MNQNFLVKASILCELCGLYSVCLFWLQTQLKEKQDKIMENTKPCMKSWITPTSFWLRPFRHQNVQCDSKQHQRQVSVGSWATECHLLGRNHVGRCFGGKSTAILGASKSEVMLFTILDGGIWNLAFIVTNLANDLLVLLQLMIYREMRQQTSALSS